MEKGFSAQEVADVKLVYELFDVTKQGSITLEELRKALKLLGFKVTRERVQQIASDVETPSSKRGHISFNAFLQVISSLQGSSYDRYSEIVQCFSYLDTDGDGLLSANDLLSNGVASGDVEGMIAEADKTATGHISREEFVEVMTRTNLYRSK